MDPTLQSQLIPIVKLAKIRISLVHLAHIETHGISSRKHLRTKAIPVFHLLHRNSTVARRVTNVTSEHYGDP